MNSRTPNKPRGTVLYHITTPMAAESILSHGFEAGDGDMGQGVYLTTNPGLFVRNLGSDVVTIRVRVRGKILSLPNHNNYLSPYRAIYGERRSGKVYEEDKDRRDAAWRVRYQSSDVLRVGQERAEEAGYVGFRDLSRNGNVVVFNPKNAEPLVILPHGQK